MFLAIGSPVNYVVSVCQGLYCVECRALVLFGFLAVYVYVSFCVNHEKFTLESD